MFKRIKAIAMFTTICNDEELLDEYLKAWGEIRGFDVDVIPYSEKLKKEFEEWLMNEIMEKI